MKNFSLVLAFMLPVAAQAVVSLPQAKEVSAYQPKAYTANYTVIRNGSALGNATVRFSALGNGRWELTTHTTGTGIAAIAGVEIVERSVLRWNQGKPETIDYNFNQKAGWKNKQRSIKVNARSQQISSQNDEKSYTLKYEPGVLDRHAVTIAVMQDLSEGKRGNLQYPVADRDELQTQLYRIMGNEKMQTGMGSFNSVKVQRIRENANGKSTTLWLANDKRYIPLRILQNESNGDVIEMNILSFR